METKKNPSADLTKKSGYFFSIGLFISTALAVMAFEWQQKDAFISLKPNRDNFTESLINIPITTITPPAPVPVKINPVIKEVDDNKEEEPEIIVIDALGDDGEDVLAIVPVPEPEETDPIFTIVEESASPKGGMVAFYKYLSEKISILHKPGEWVLRGKFLSNFL